ncbi:MAG: hypothetical protein NWE98_11655 [Candidatus Bathyarchaeota archaeon]|nr:hypothetical protein [Candidatus Bathyarchaeota archaeon]
MLDRLGFKPIEIAAFLGKSPDNIGVQLNIIRKKKGKPRSENKTEINTSKEEAEVKP